MPRNLNHDLASRIIRNCYIFVFGGIYYSDYNYTAGRLIGSIVDLNSNVYMCLVSFVMITLVLV